MVQDIQVHIHYQTPHTDIESFVQGIARCQRIFLCICHSVHWLRIIGSSSVWQWYREVFQHWGNISYSFPNDAGRLGLWRDCYVSAGHGTSENHVFHFCKLPFTALATGLVCVMDLHFCDHSAQFYRRCTRRSVQQSEWFFLVHEIEVHKSVLPLTRVSFCNRE